MKTAFLVFTACFALITSCAVSADEVFGPPNLLKAGTTPFNSSADSQVKKDTGTLTLDSAQGAGRSSLLSRRLVPCRVYLPGRVIIGKPAEFVVKGRPGQQAAVAMADKNTGAKTLYGKEIRLAPTEN